MRIGLVSRTDKKEAVQLVEKIAEQFSHHDLYYDPGLLPFLKGEPIETVDVLVVVGGDGTILRTVQKYSFPILAVKMGTHGHLCEVVPDDVASLEGILREHSIERRMKINVPGVGEALNEVVVRAEVPDKVAQFSIECGHYCGSVRGDGIIVATPTGSTAYSLAAGGPIIEEECSVFCITPICPLNAAFFPRIVPSEWEVRITVVDKSCYMALDGLRLSRLAVGDSIRIKKSENFAEFWRKKRV